MTLLYLLFKTKRKHKMYRIAFIRPKIADRKRMEQMTRKISLLYKITIWNAKTIRSATNTFDDSHEISHVSNNSRDSGRDTVRISSFQEIIWCSYRKRNNYLFIYRREYPQYFPRFCIERLKANELDEKLT